MKNSILVSGASGRMGQQIIKELSIHGFMVSKLKRTGEIEGDTHISFCVDFSLPEGFANVLSVCERLKIPLVSGTTGLSDKQFDQLESLSKIVPVLWSPNMSIGVALLKEALSILTRLRDADLVLEEAHHRHKKDSPSGTALALLEQLKIDSGNQIVQVNCTRAGGIVGQHAVSAITESEVLKFEHIALDRSIFAKGAIVAGQWLCGKSPARYSMANFVGELK